MASFSSRLQHNDPSSGHHQIQLVRLNGQYLQTLYCSTRIIRSILWSPDARTVVFNVLSPTGVINPHTPLTMYELNMMTGALSPLLNATTGTGYTPLIWGINPTSPIPCFTPRIIGLATLEVFLLEYAQQYRNRRQHSSSGE